MTSEQAKEKARAATRAWRKANPDRVKAQKQAYYERHGKREREKARERHARNPEPSRARSRVQRLARFGLTEEKLAEMMATQNGRCAICREVPEGTLNIDHNHSTGAVRELLCTRCNVLVGMSRERLETLESAIAYLKRHR